MLHCSAMPSWLTENLGGILNSIGLILLAIWASVFARQGGNDSTKLKLPQPKSHASKILLTLAVLFALGGIGFQLFSAFQHHSNDTTLVRYYDDKWDDSTQKRKLAATTLIEYLQKGDWSSVTNDTYALNSVLGFFDKLGQAVVQGQMSGNVAHEHFAADIQVYYQASAEYIAETQSDAADTTTFENVKPLFDEVMKIEASKNKKATSAFHLSKSDLLEYLQSEISAVNLKESK